MPVMDTNLLVLCAVVLAALLVGWLLLARSRKSSRRRFYRPDVLDEGVAPASRNQALIDAPGATTAALAASGPDVMAGIGEIIAAASPTGDADDLTLIKGVGPKLAALLASLGITRFDQIAAWSDADIVRIDARLGAFAGRPLRDNWIGQARLLASSDVSGYEAKFGKLTDA